MGSEIVRLPKVLPRFMDVQNSAISCLDSVSVWILFPQILPEFASDSVQVRKV